MIFDTRETFAEYCRRTGRTPYNPHEPLPAYEPFGAYLRRTQTASSAGHSHMSDAAVTLQDEKEEVVMEATTARPICAQFSCGMPAFAELRCELVGNPDNWLTGTVGYVQCIDHTAEMSRRMVDARRSFSVRVL